MLRPTIRNICIYFLIKYMLFFTFMAVRTQDFYFIKPGIRNGVDLFYYFYVFLFLPAVCCIVFSFPLRSALRNKNEFYFIGIMAAFFFVEYVMYTYFASRMNYENGLYNELISVLLFIFFFFKNIREVFR